MVLTTVNCPGVRGKIPAVCRRLLEALGNKGKSAIEEAAIRNHCAPGSAVSQKLGGFKPTEATFSLTARVEP